MDKTCFCKPDIMSQCAPLGLDIRICHFYDKHSTMTGCSFQVLDGCCDSHLAQMHGYYPFVITRATPVRVNYSESYLEYNKSTEDAPERSCDVCRSNPCIFVVKAEIKGPISYGTKVQMANNCVHFDRR